jgi:hypothetical protein
MDLILVLKIIFFFYLHNFFFVFNRHFLPVHSLPIQKTPCKKCKLKFSYCLDEDSLIHFNQGLVVFSPVCSRARGGIVEAA